MITEIEKPATGQSRNYLTNMWQEDCRRNEEISKKRWQNKNLIWLNKYEENFRTKYQNKNPFIKEPDETDRSKTYAEISGEQPKARKQRPNPAEKQRQGGGQNKDPLLPLFYFTYIYKHKRLYLLRVRSKTLFVFVHSTVFLFVNRDGIYVPPSN